jgi:subtilisin-like proprotein convertase family protein
MKSPFDRFLPSAPKARQRKASRKAAELQPEQLEKRAMMAIVTANPGLAGPASNYLIVASDEASDVYIQQHAGGRLLIADNSSFLANGNFSETLGVPDILYITNGAQGTGPGPMFAGDNTAGKYQTDAQLSPSTGFTLSAANIVVPSYDLDINGRRIEKDGAPANPLPSEAFQISNPFKGTVSYDGATWDFEIDPAGPLVTRLRPTGNQSPSASPLSGGVTFNSTTRGRLVLNWGNPATDQAIPVATVPNAANPAVAEPPIINIVTYFVAGAASSTLPGATATPSADAQILPSVASTKHSFTIPASVYASGALRGIVPGSLMGSVTIDGVGIPFQDDFITDAFPRPLYFNGQTSFAVNAFVSVSGSYVVVGDEVAISLSCTSAPIGPNVASPTSYIAYVEDSDPNSFTLFAGHDLTSQLSVDLLSPDSTINIDSRLDVRTQLTDADSNIEDVILRATNVNIDSVIDSTDDMLVGASAIGSALAESLLINAPVAAPDSFIIDIEDDPATASLRGVVFISPSGSLLGSLQPSAGGEPVGTDLILVRAVQSDIFAAGTVFGDRQSYLFQSDAAGQALAPYSFTTRSRDSGVDTGLIRGDVVSITLGNDAPTPIDESIAFNTLDLSTRVNSMRIRAATQQLGGPVPFPDPSPSGPFPYNLTIREYDDITFDAVASSGLPISLSASGAIGMSSALNTVGDVFIKAARPNDRQVAADATFDFTVSAPITTTKGRINIQADSVFVNNSVGVTDAAVDDGRDDITLTANSGNILLSGLVSAINGVNLTQRSSSTSRGTPLAPYFDPNFQPISIPDATAADGGAGGGGGAGATGAAVALINVNDDFQFSDLDVVLTIKHPFVGDLSATLIAPDGRKYKLFEKSSNRGNDYVNTIFDSEATTPIAGATPPYTGRFKSLDSFEPMYGNPETRLSTLGTWKLEVVDNTPRDAGTLEKFQLVFSKTGNQVSGSAFITADRLFVEAEGAVGNPVKQPTANDFYLNTNVDEMRVQAGTSVAISEQDDVNIKSLRAGDLVSIKAGGVDPLTGPNAMNAALRARIIDVPVFDVSAANGSIDVRMVTANTTTLGNAAALQKGTAINSLAAGNVRLRSEAGSIVALDAPVAGSGARTVRVATTANLAGVYAAGTPGFFPSTLRVASASILALNPSTGPSLRINDRILIKNQADQTQNGVYSITNTTNPASWVLTRATDSDTAVEMPASTIVKVLEGSQTGFYRMLWNNDASVFGTTPITVADAGLDPGKPRQLTTDIGSDDFNDTVTFVVSTAAGTNSSAGSLGKMIDLRQQNSALTNGGLSPQRSDLKFSSLVATTRTPIRLTQELPVINESIVIDGGLSSRFLPKGVAVPANAVAANPVIDGSRIVTTRTGRAVTAADTVNGLMLSNVDGVIIRNLTIGGFNINDTGAAISVQDSPNVLIEKVVLGQNEGGALTPNATGTRLANAIGVRVVGAASDTTTITNSTILSSNDAGIKVENGASYVRVAGNTIGKPGLENNVGVNFVSGVNALGIDSAPQVQAMARRVNNNTFTLPAGTFEVARRLVPGMGVIGRRVVQANPNVPVTIASVTVNEKTKITTVRVTGGSVTSNGSVILGYVVRTERNSSVISLGVPLDSPEGRSRLMGLYLGQQVNGMGIAFGTTITKISEGDTATNVPATITLSQPMTMTGVTSISLSSVGRNVIQANRTGVILGVGSTTMTNTSVIDSNFNGVEIHGGSHTIGTSMSRSPTSNAIHGNGRWGIAYLSNAVSRAAQFIRGNYLGANQSTIVSTVLANKKGNIGPVSDTDDSAYLGEIVRVKDKNGKVKKVNQLEPDIRTGVDAAENQHGIMPVVATRGRSRFPWRA